MENLNTQLFNGLWLTGYILGKNANNKYEHAGR